MDEEAQTMDQEAMKMALEVLRAVKQGHATPARTAPPAPAPATDFSFAPPAPATDFSFAPPVVAPAPDPIKDLDLPSVPAAATRIIDRPAAPGCLSESYSSPASVGGGPAEMAEALLLLDRAADSLVQSGHDIKQAVALLRGIAGNM